MASHQAAGRAADAGYTNVSVLADGLMGWKKAGKKTEAPKS
jgi:rhodanese-related sulfurtransferase